MTKRGESVLINQEAALERKYNGFTYIFDIGGSYESQVELYGGKVDRVGKDGPRVNPSPRSAVSAPPPMPIRWPATTSMDIRGGSTGCSREPYSRAW
jgi:hypothetical protein